MKFNSSKPNYKITQIKSTQLVSYMVRNVLKRHWYLPPTKKEDNNMQQQIQAAQSLTFL